ncbi:sensor histidine kinase [Candidatus Leptofilum sp.]|uniref:sensor histidine kinase n=1 Tax=Candidatus Leptofilum sp. TaxID=3241576 RepID=UPI003B5BC392
MRRLLRKMRPSHWVQQFKQRRGRRVTPKQIRVGDELIILKEETMRFGRLRRPFRFIWRGLSWLFGLLRRAWSRFRWMTRSLWFRLMGAFAVVIFLMLFIVMSVVGNITARAFRQYITQRNQAITAILPSLVEDPETLDDAEIIITGDEIIIRRVVPRPTVPPPPQFPNFPDIDFEPPEIVAESPEVVVSPPVVVETDGETAVTEEVIVLDWLDVLAPSSPEVLGLSFLSDVQEAAQTAVIAAGVVSLVLGTLLFWQITRPMSQMRRASQALAAGEPDVRVPVRSQDELGKVAEAFNQMASKISEQEQLRRQMVADVAHELRTPLTVMQANLEAMLDGLLEPNPTELQELNDEVHRLSRLIDDLRLLSFADSGQLSLTLQEVDVRELASTVVARLAPLAETREVRLVDDAPGKLLIVLADADRIQQALTNLVANGIRHTPKGGRVRVTAVQEQTTIHLSVIDSGPGIPPDDLPNVFDRFWRGDKSRSRHSGGSGLGLAIVKQIAELHQGRVSVLSPSGSGAVFTISLPVFSNQ